MEKTTREDENGSLSNSCTSFSPDGIFPQEPASLKERAFTLKDALTKQKKFPQSRDILTEWVIKRFPTSKWVVHLLNRDWIMATLASAHLTLFAAFGVWVWFTIHHFGDCESFTGDTRLTILPQVNIRVTSPLRIWFIMLYIICLVPFLYIVLICALELLAIYIFRSIFPPRSRRKFNLGSFIVLTLLVQVYFIVATELTIWTNRPLLVDSAQEGDWTFGQTLAIALVAIPLTEVAAQGWKERGAVWAMITGLVKAAWVVIKGLVKGHISDVFCSARW